MQCEPKILKALMFGTLITPKSGANLLQCSVLITNGAETVTKSLQNSASPSTGFVTFGLLLGSDYG